MQSFELLPEMRKRKGMQRMHTLKEISLLQGFLHFVPLLDVVSNP